MIQNDSSALLRRARSATERLDKAVHGADPFETIAAQRDAERVLDELNKSVAEDRAYEAFRAAQGTPRPLFAERPGGAPVFSQSGNAGSSPRDSGQVPVTPSAGSIGRPPNYPQSSNYAPEERRAAALLGYALPDGSHVIRNADDLGEALIAWGLSGSPAGALRDHIGARARALGLAGSLPPGFKVDKLALAAGLRKR